MKGITMSNSNDVQNGYHEDMIKYKKQIELYEKICSSIERKTKCKN
jgi:hypothetical protein